MGNIILSNQSKRVYLDRLVGKLFKILPMYEEQGNKVPQTYLYALIVNVNTFSDMCDGMLVDIVIKLEELYNGQFRGEEIKKSDVRRLVLECTNLTKKLIEGLVNDGKSD